jgi:hypothetical protein
MILTDGGTYDSDKMTGEILEAKKARIERQETIAEKHCQERMAKQTQSKHD